MTVEDQNFELRQGEDATLAYLVVDSSVFLPPPNDDQHPPLNVGGYLITWELNEGAEDDTHVLRFLTTDPSSRITIENGNGTDDRVLVKLVGDDTRTLDAGVYHAELRLQGGPIDPEQVGGVGSMTLRLSPTRAGNPTP